MKKTNVANVNRLLELQFGNPQLTFYKDTFEQQMQIEIPKNCTDDEEDEGEFYLWTFEEKKRKVGYDDKQTGISVIGKSYFWVKVKEYTFITFLITISLQT